MKIVNIKQSYIPKTLVFFVKLYVIIILFLLSLENNQMIDHYKNNIKLFSVCQMCGADSFIKTQKKTLKLNSFMLVLSNKL